MYLIESFLSRGVPAVHVASSHYYLALGDGHGECLVQTRLYETREQSCVKMSARSQTSCTGNTADKETHSPS